MTSIVTRSHVLLINLRSTDYPVASLPLALPTLGGTIKQVFGDTCDVSYFDRQLSDWLELSDFLAATKPDLIGISAQFGTTDDLHECLALVREVSPAALCVVGNVVGTYAADELASRYDNLLCCAGRGEELMVRLIEDLRKHPAQRDLAAAPNLVYADRSGQIRHTASRAVPSFCVAAVDWDGYAAGYDLHAYEEIWIEGSRGCPQKRNNVGCTYCAILPDAGSRDWKPRSLDLVMTDLAGLARHWVPHVRFADEEFMANQPERAVEFAQAVEALATRLGPTFTLPTFDVAMRVDDVVRPNPAHDRPRPHLVGGQAVTIAPNELRELALRRLQQVGLRQVYLGVESGSRNQLRRMRKGVTPDGNRRALDVLRAIGLQAACGWIMFDPFLTSSEDLIENIEFLEQNSLIPSSLEDTFVTSPINTMRVLVGTPLKDQVEQAGLLRDLMPNLLEYDFVYQNDTIGRLVHALSVWRSGYDQATMYALKNWVAHAALDPSVRIAEHHGYALFFDLKRLDFEVCKWLVEDLQAAEHNGEHRHRFEVPEYFYDRRAYLLGRTKFLLDGTGQARESMHVRTGT